MANETILIVDDDLDLSTTIKVMLESENYSVATASSREEGMEKIKAAKPDLVILDVMMSTWQDGFEMARELKIDSKIGDNMPILMLTGVKGETGIDFKSTAGDSTRRPGGGVFIKTVE